jgi:glycosyl transferase family 4
MASNIIQPPMRILYVADGRSSIAQNWIRHFVERGDEVYLASTFACNLDFPVKELELTPVAFSSVKKVTERPGTAPARTVGLRTAIRQWFGPVTIRSASPRLREFVQRVKPDLVHAMRIPYEGMLAADAYTGAPLLVSTWGNDFTLHGPSTSLMKHYTRWTMQVADALHADCQRDIRLANEWGFAIKKPSLVAPGNGGIRSDIFYPPAEPVREPVIINPRGFRPYVRNDVFFKAIPLVLAKHPEAKFIFALMAGEPHVEKWIQELKIDQAIELLPPLSHAGHKSSPHPASMTVHPTACSKASPAAASLWQAILSRSASGLNLRRTACCSMPLTRNRLPAQSCLPSKMIHCVRKLQN